MRYLLILDLVGSVIVIATFTLAALRWGRKIARGVAGWVERVGDNTSATRELTTVVGQVRDDIREVVSTLKEHGEQLQEHGERLTSAEARITRMEGR